MTRLISIALAIIAALALLVAQSAQGAVTIQLRDRATVDPASVFSVRDIADIIGDPASVTRIGNVTLATAPLAGIERSMESSYVRLKIKAANLLKGTVVSGAKQTIVTGRSSSVSADRLMDEAKACILALLPQDGRVYDVTVERPPKDLIVDGSADYSISPKLLAMTAKPGMNSVSLEVVSNGKTIGRSTCSLKVKALGDVVVAVGQIRQGDTVNTDNTRIEKREVGALDTSYIVAARLMNGHLVAKRTIAAGALLGTNDVQSPPIIHKGDSVTVVVKCGAVRLTTSAIAKQDAWQGDVVAIRPDMSSSDLRGTVSEQGIVELIR